MAVTPDEYELPIAVEESLYMLAQRLGVTTDSIRSMIYHNSSGRYAGYKCITFDMEEE